MKPTGLIGINRHRIGIDGNGITTLVAFHGCTLRCKYCLNPTSLSSDRIWKHYTPEQLYNELKIDNLYFMATGGGVTFGGGEPCLQHSFIKEFRSLCGNEWHITLETALNVPSSNITALLPIVDHWIVDIKDMDNSIYMAYTGGKSNLLVQNNLKRLIEANALITVRVPLIPGFNDEEAVKQSILKLKEMGICDIEQFKYTTKIPQKKKQVKATAKNSIGNRLTDSLTKSARRISSLLNQPDIVPGIVTTGIIDPNRFEEYD